MDWTKIAGPLAQVGATALGTLIGGPAGAVIGNVVGPAIAAALGVETPEQVAELAAKAPDDVRSAAATAEALPDVRAAIAEADARMLAEINATMRAESSSEGWLQRTWRPAFGLSFAFVWTLHGLALAHALFTRQFEIIAKIPDLTVFYGVAGAVVGVYAWKRTEEKLAAPPAGLPGVMGSAIGTLAKAAGRQPAR